VWYTGQAAGLLGRLAPETGKIMEYPLPDGAKNPHTPIVYRGKVWFTDANNNSYGTLDLETWKAKVYQAPTPSSIPYGIVAGPDNFIWIAFLGTNKLGRVNPSDGTIKEFPLPAAEARPRRLQVGSDGTVWYTDYERGYLGALDPKTGRVREWKSPSADAGPYGIAIGTDGRIWYCESRTGQMVAFDPRTEKMEVVPIPTPHAIVRHMETDSTRHRIWLALSGTGRLGKIELGH
jgi:virginiamycin B lyase